MKTPFASDRPFVPYFLILAAIFVAAFLLGFVAPPSLRGQLTEAFQTFLAQYGDMAGGKLFFEILFHNVVATLALVGSGLLFGIIPTFVVCGNGLLLGIVYRQAAEAFGHAEAASQIVPHGVFEIPALVYAGAYGLWLGITVVRRLRGKENTPLSFHIAHAFRRYLAVVFPLLILAAAIETYFMLRAQ